MCVTKYAPKVVHGDHQDAYDLTTAKGREYTSQTGQRLMTITGFIMSFLSLIVATIYFFWKILHWDSFDLGIAPIIIGLFTLGFFQIFILGFIGEYVMNILVHARKLPLVIEKERINFD